VGVGGVVGVCVGGGGGGGVGGCGGGGGGGGRKGKFLIVGLRIVHLSIPQECPRCNTVSEFRDHVKCVPDCKDTRIRGFTTNFLP